MKSIHKSQTFIQMSKFVQSCLNFSKILQTFKLQPFFFQLSKFTSGNCSKRRTEHGPLQWSVDWEFLWIFFFCNRGDISITAQLQTRKFGEAPILLQAVSSHPHVFIMILLESMNFHPVKQLFQISHAGHQTANPWVTSPTLSPYTTGTSLLWILTF